jgi:hypothetical protein
MVVPGAAVAVRIVLPYLYRGGGVQVLTVGNCPPPRA